MKRLLIGLLGLLLLAPSAYAFDASGYTAQNMSATNHGTPGANSVFFGKSAVAGAYGYFLGSDLKAYFDTLYLSVTGNAPTATALAANGGNCSAGSYPLGVNASGAAESCTDATTEIDSAIGAHAGDTTSVHGISDTSAILVDSDVGVGVQAYDADLTTYAGITPSANVQTFLGYADFSAMRTGLSLVPGTDVQAYSAYLKNIADFTLSANALVGVNAGATGLEQKTSISVNLNGGAGDAAKPACWGSGSPYTLGACTAVTDVAFLPLAGGTLSGTHDFGSAVVEIPNGTSGTTDADGEVYLDTDGDGGTNFSGPVIQIDAGTGAGYLFPIALPLAASQDNYVIKYDATGRTVQWEADATAGSPTFDAIGNGTNTTAAMVVGTGASLGASGTGTITANVLDAVGAAAIAVGSADVTQVVVTTDSTGDDEVQLPANSIGSAEINTVVTSASWIGGALVADGTQCAVPTVAQLDTTGPRLYTVICADNDGSSIYGDMVMPDSWDGGTVTFELAYIQTAADTGALNADVTAQCRGATEVPSSTWGTEVAIDDAAVTGTGAEDMTTSGAVTPAGTCAGGDHLFWRIQLDAAGTDTAVATLNLVGVKMEYTSNVGD